MTSLLNQLSSTFRSFDLVYFAYVIVALVLALTLHEVSHAYVAYIQGDVTAKSQGRLTLNPLRHIDPIGLIFLILFHFGWAKPVMMNPYNFKHYRDGIMFTALAGPAANFLLAWLAALLLHVPFLGFAAPFLTVFITYNLILAAFNLIPVPPLDGYKVFTRVLSDRLFEKSQEIEIRYGMIILLVFIFTGAYSYVLYPVMDLLVKLLNLLSFGALY